jgi:hypothetical protein
LAFGAKTLDTLPVCRVERRHKPHGTAGDAMTKDDFWKLIDKSRRGTEDDDEQTDKLQELLAKLPPKEILNFQLHFERCIRGAYPFTDRG